MGISEQSVQPLQLGSLTFKDAVFTGIAIKATTPINQQYYVSIAKSISRILTTRIGERVMQPEFGSYLYLLRDRDFNSEWRVNATRYIFEALRRWEPRVRFSRLHFNVDSITGRHDFYLELEPND